MHTQQTHKRQNEFAYQMGKSLHSSRPQFELFPMWKQL